MDDLKKHAVDPDKTEVRQSTKFMTITRRNAEFILVDISKIGKGILNKSRSPKGNIFDNDNGLSRIGPYGFK